MKTVGLRPALLSDLPLLVSWKSDFNALEGVAFDQAQLEPAVRALLKGRNTFVLTANTELAGYAVITWSRGRTAYLTELFLRAELRRQGLGVRVMELLEAEARRADARALHLRVGETHHAAQKVDARRGVTQPKRPRPLSAA